MTIQNILQKQTLVAYPPVGCISYCLNMFRVGKGNSAIERPLYVHQTLIHWPPSHSFL